MKKLIAIASVGGHWVQLLRLRPAFLDFNVIYVSTHKNLKETVNDKTFYLVTDANRWDKIKLLICFWEVLKIMVKEKPDAVITTGAAPGLCGIIIARFIGIKSIWVDSIANVEELSLSGKIALKFANKVYTQWPEVSDSKVLYFGNVLS